MFYESGRKDGCEGCALGPRRGAKGPWVEKPGPTEVRARMAALAKWRRRGRNESGQFTG
jgi:hypothetical protein